MNDEVFYSAIEDKIKFVSINAEDNNIYTLDGAAAELFQILVGDISDSSEEDLQKKYSLNEAQLTQFRKMLVRTLTDKNILLNT